MKAKSPVRKKKSRKANNGGVKKTASKTRGMKKGTETESLLNALARGVGRAAGTLARATRRIATSGEASEVMAPEESGTSSVTPRHRRGVSSKRAKAKSASRKPRRLSKPGA